MAVDDGSAIAVVWSALFAFIVFATAEMVVIWHSFSCCFNSMGTFDARSCFVMKLFDVSDDVDVDVNVAESSIDFHFDLIAVVGDLVDSNKKGILFLKTENLDSHFVVAFSYLCNKFEKIIKYKETH